MSSSCCRHTGPGIAAILVQTGASPATATIGSSPRGHSIAQGVANYKLLALIASTREEFMVEAVFGWDDKSMIN